ncbi:hypothetical protein [Pseudorhodoferax sp.]|uniref:hypothetical protein n=1 Tax=Pseudorhodoferax sp. TaxID=1993553 RepID=UPI001B680404|nr:hypothetical protein [Pseudorhodoferax sp.]MBP8143702.1 hypothetical protein [Inhella sp.]
MSSSAHRKALLLVTLGVLCGAALGTRPVCPPQPVRVSLSDYPTGDYLKGQGDAIADPDPGRLVLELRAVERRLGCRLVLLRLPNPRQLIELKRGEIDIATAMPAAVAQAQGLDLPLRDGRPDESLAVAHSDINLVVQRGREAELGEPWRTRQRPNGVVGIPTQGMAADLARAQGWRTQALSRMHRGPDMLRLGRIDYWLVALASLPEELKLQDGKLVALQPAVLRTAYFHAARPAFRARNPAFVQAFWRAVHEASRDTLSELGTTGR